MFIDELTPLIRELSRQPIAFFGGFCSGVLRLNLADDPVRTWLDQQTNAGAPSSSTYESPNGQRQGPQSISID